MSKYGGQNLFAALDSDEDDVAPPAAPKPTQAKAAPKPAAVKKQQVRNNKPRSGNDRRDRRPRNDDRQRPARGGESWGNSNAYEGRSGDRRRQNARPGARDRELAKKKTRKPRNGYGKDKAGPKKGGAGAHNWGTATENNAAADADAAAAAATSADAADKPKVEAADKVEKVEEPKPEPEPETFTLAQFEAMRLEKLKNNTAFAPLEARKVESDVAGEAYQKPSVVQVRHKKKGGHAGHNSQIKNSGDVSKFFVSAPRAREEFGGRGRGRGRGRGGGRGRGYSRSNDRNTRQPRGQRVASAQINIQDETAFPSL